MPARLPQTIRTGDGRISFWVASAAVFLANSLLSVASRSWVLATLQAMTATLAVLAAVDAWASKPVTGPPTELPGKGLPQLPE